MKIPSSANWPPTAPWSLWFRADSPENNQELHRLMKLPIAGDAVREVLAGYRSLLTTAPRFAEAYNQRAILFYRLGDMAKSIADCERALRLNPYHFGAASGMAQCFMKQKKLRAALRSYRRANRINPRLDGVKQVIDSLERMLGEKDKRTPPAESLIRRECVAGVEVLRNPGNLLTDWREPGFRSTSTPATSAHF